MAGRARRGPRVVVFGGLGMDCVVATPTLPRWGDDLLVDRVRMTPGGKGLNQAVALARLDANVTIVATVGSDAVGDDLLTVLDAEGVDTSLTPVRDAAATTVCVVLTHPDGSNAFLWRIAPELELRPMDVTAAEGAIAAGDAVLLTFDLTPITARAVIETAARHRTPVVINPAPVPAGLGVPAAYADLPWEKVALATPNAREARLLLEAAGDPAAVGPPELLAGAFGRRFGTGAVCVTRSEHGATFYDRATNVTTHRPAWPTTVVDTTAASDVLTAVLTAGLFGRSGAEGCGPLLERALAAAAWTVARQGAYDALPTAADLAAGLEAGLTRGGRAEPGRSGPPDQPDGSQRRTELEGPGRPGA